MGLDYFGSKKRKALIYLISMEIHSEIRQSHFSLSRTVRLFKNLLGGTRAIGNSIYDTHRS
jgi:hypothetical protein